MFKFWESTIEGHLEFHDSAMRGISFSNFASCEPLNVICFSFSNEYSPKASATLEQGQALVNSNDTTQDSLKRTVYYALCFSSTWFYLLLVNGDGVALMHQSSITASWMNNLLPYHSLYNNCPLCYLSVVWNVLLKVY